MDIIVYLLYGKLVGIGKSQQNNFRIHSVKDNILLRPIEVAIDIGGSPAYDCFIILEVGP